MKHFKSRSIGAGI